MSDQDRRTEFGDFQTPLETARAVCHRLAELGYRPRAVVEPTCGEGAFLLAATEAFPKLATCRGFEVNPEYVARARRNVARAGVRVEQRNFFEQDWSAALNPLPRPLLVLGNPPWVTNSALGRLDRGNLPLKRNAEGLRGLDALTGKSNFDISEWMLARLLESLQKCGGTVAMLCKAAVARKILVHAARRQLAFANAKLLRLDSRKIFSASVDAGLFVFDVEPGRRDYVCADHDSLAHRAPARIFGYADGRLVAETTRYARFSALESVRPAKWRSGLKHDCARVMELRRNARTLTNGLGETVTVEPAFVYSLLKSSDLNANRVAGEARAVLVTQKRTGEDTRPLETRAPRLWSYLRRHETAFARRKSAIYRNRPPFSIFGVGDYSFAPWKVAVSGLYKNGEFALVGRSRGKPIMLDDTCSFLPFADEAKARAACALLRSDEAAGFLDAVVFWDAKRPLGAETLGRLDLARIAARALGGRHAKLFQDSGSPQNFESNV